MMASGERYTSTMRWYMSSSSSRLGGVVCRARYTIEHTLLSVWTWKKMFERKGEKLKNETKANLWHILIDNLVWQVTDSHPKKTANHQHNRDVQPNNSIWRYKWHTRWNDTAAKSYDFCRYIKKISQKEAFPLRNLPNQAKLDTGCHSSTSYCPSTWSAAKNVSLEGLKTS